MSLIDEFRKLIVAMNAAALPYAVVGALALAVYGAARATKDIDLLILPEDLDRVLEVVAKVGFTLPGPRIAFPSSGITIRRVSKVVDGEVLTLELLLATGPLHSHWDDRQKLESPHGDVWVISRDSLVQMKLIAGRLKDLADIERLQEGDDG